ncbi:MAG: CdaR family protein [Lachnospiraceae bacterium]|nr:CdaR family protein [Lachnospiraceae bacterium]
MDKNFFRKLMQGLTNDLGLKILSALIAIVIWYQVVNYDDPQETASYTVQVEVTNDSYIANGKRTFSIGEDYTNVVVYIRTNRSVLRKLQASNVVVTADLTQIVDITTDPVYVPLQVSCAGVNQDDITLSRTTIPIYIEDIASEKFAVVVDQGDSVPAQNYEVGKLVPDTESVTITGPESVIEKIGTVKATIDVSGMTEDGKVTADLSLLDKEQNELSSSTLASLTFDGGVPSIDVAVTLWEKLSGVRVVSEYSGSPAEGYQVTEVAVLPSETAVVGSSEALAELAAADNTITIPGSMVSAAAAAADVDVTVELSDLLPDDCRLASSSSETVQVSLTILPDDSQEYLLDVDDVNVKGLDSNYTISYDSTTIAVRVKRSDSSKEDLKLSDISLSIDVSDKTAGEYTVPVQVKLPDGYELVEDVTLAVRIKAKAESS